MRKKEPYKQDWTFMFSLNYFLLPSHLHWVITLLFQDTNQEAKLQGWVWQIISVYERLQVIPVHIGIIVTLWTLKI